MKKQWMNPEVANLAVDATKDNESKGGLFCECCADKPYFGNITDPTAVHALAVHRLEVHGTAMGEPCPIS